MVNEPYQGFDRYLILDASFDETNLKGIRVAMTGANDDLPADGTQPLAGLWQVTLGLNGGTRNSDLSFILAEAILANEKVESFVEALHESIGSMENLRPNHSVGESCGGF